MRKALICLILAFGVSAGPVGAAETYDLIFKTGTLSDISSEEVLEYSRDVSIAADTEQGARKTGTVQLSFEAEQTARLKFTQGEKSQNLGAFPSTVGNPIIMYFVETVLRDVAQQAGGSPFYIRNRIKESLVQPADILESSVTHGTDAVTAQTITLRPFENDKNRDRMKGYGDLEITFTMSQDVPGWYQSLVAQVPTTNSVPSIYRNELILQAGEVAQ